MYSKIIKNSRLKNYTQRKLLLISFITMGILCPSNAISQSLTKPKFDEVNIHSNKSFITKAVERTGSSVVTIDTQKYIKKENFQEILNCLWIPL